MPEPLPVDTTGMALAIAILVLAVVCLWLSFTSSLWFLLPWAGLTVVGAVGVGRSLEGGPK
jgi:fatty acid desaturase